MAEVRVDRPARPASSPTTDGRDLGGGRDRAGGGVATELLRDTRAPTTTPSRCTRFERRPGLRSRILGVFEARRPRPHADRAGSAQLRRRRRRRDGRRDGRRAGRHDRADDDRRVPRPRGHDGARCTSSTSGTTCSARSRERAHELCRARFFATQGCGAAPRHQGHRGRARARDARRRHARSRRGAWCGAAASQAPSSAAARPGVPQGRGGRIDVQPRPDGGGLPAPLRGRRRRQHPRPRRQAAARSSAPWRSRAARGRPRTCSPTSPGARRSRSSTRTRASWR